MKAELTLPNIRRKLHTWRKSLLLKTVRLTCRSARTRGSTSAAVLAGIVQLSQGQPRDKNYHRIEGTELWILGMDANHCWPRSLILAKKIKMDIRVHFRWREKEKAAHPGEEGLLQWSPSH
jgi:hypothetical protein